MKFNLCMPEPTLVKSAMATLLAIALGPVGEALSATVTPHRAFYEMQLGNVDQNSNVRAVTGRSAFTLGRDCSGWQSNEDYVIEFGGKEGDINLYYIAVSVLGIDSGDMYSFEISEQAVFKQIKTLAMPT